MTHSLYVMQITYYPYVLHNSLDDPLLLDYECFVSEDDTRKRMHEIIEQGKNKVDVCYTQQFMRSSLEQGVAYMVICVYEQPTNIDVKWKYNWNRAMYATEREAQEAVQKAQANPRFLKVHLLSCSVVLPRAI